LPRYRTDSEIAMEISPASTPPSPPSATAETPKSSRHRRDSVSDVVDITVSYDFGWDKRGNGFQYNSHSGRGCLIGKQTKKILGYRVVSAYCYMCARGLKPDNHVCARNYKGSSKGMEPKTAVDLIVKNPDLAEAGVRVSTVIADKDSSTTAALNRESSHPIRKIVDLNHEIKSVGKRLWKLKTKEGYNFLTAVAIDYLKRCLSYAITANAGDAEKVKNAILNITPHTFGEHQGCSTTWCKAQNNPEYKFKHLPGGKAFSNPNFRRALTAIFTEESALAQQLAPVGSSLQNESFNHMCVTRAPKTRHYCGTNALQIRVASAVCTKNYGAGYLERSFQKAHLSPSTSKFRKALQKKSEWRGEHQKKVPVKRRRLYLKMKNTWKEAGASAKEGVSYASGMASTMERAADASSIRSWLPEPTPLLQTCRPVLVDIETTGFSGDADIVQIAAKCGDAEFNAFIIPQKKFDPRASEVTGMTVEGGRLKRNGEVLTTVPAEQAVRDFFNFLKSCSSQVILAGHNFERFDGPRIMKLFAAHELAQHLCSITFGITDTLPLIKQGPIKKQALLASTYLKGPYWEDALKNAHDALADCRILQGLLHHFEVSDNQLIESVLPIKDFMEKCVSNNRRNRYRPQLMVMKNHGVSEGMIGKMAAQGVTIEELTQEYAKHGRRGLEVCLGVQLGGKPRVTKCKKVLDKIESFLKCAS